MEFSSGQRIGNLLKDKNIILRGPDMATAMGFTQVPNFLLKSKNLSAGDKLAFAMLLSYAWQNDFCFPGQQRLAEDMGITDRSVRTHLKALESNGLLVITQRGQGKTNLYELNLKPPGRKRPMQTGRKLPLKTGRFQPLKTGKKLPVLL